MRKNYLLFILFILSPILTYATHLRAGEITATRISGTQLTYRITLITYTDEIGGKAANDGQESVFFNFGFSTTRLETMKVSRKQRILINAATVRNVYDTTYTFPAAGYYTIGCGIVNRNANTINLPVLDGSANVSFFVQTSILINSNIGFNSTPVLLNAPIDSAAVGQRFVHNPGAFDIDGDSISYKLTIPRRDQGVSVETGIGVFIKEYLEPNMVGDPPLLNQAGTGPATFTIDPRTGDLIWDAPRKAGQYNVAFIVEEWRKGYDGGYIKIGEIVRDMQIIVVETDNVAPVLTIPDDICIEAGETVEFEVFGEDKNLQQKLKLSSSGAIYNVNPAGQPTNYIPLEVAKFTSTITVGKVKGTFKWTTNCLHARQQAYNVVFKVEDNPGRTSTQLVDLKTLNIRVLPPRPRALVVKEVEKGHKLNWTALSTCNENGKILVYRKSGCSGLNPGSCTSGIPTSWGYQLIAEVSSKDSTFLDLEIEKGGIYSYRLVTEIAENDFINIQSAPSIEFCIGSEIKAGSSVIKKASVKETSETNGTVEVKWTEPVNVNLKDLKGDFFYKLYRTEGIGGEKFSLIHTQSTTFSDTLDLYFLDKNLNTKDLTYRYKVEFYTEGTKLSGTSNPASTVRLSSVTSQSAVPLSWEANTPWINQVHYIYREDPKDNSKYNLIKKLETSDPNAFKYTDKGEDLEIADGDISMPLINGETYCYKVLTIGQYESFASLGLLYNYSQITCSTPLDQSPPCTPTLAISGGRICSEINPEEFCKDGTFSNIIKWDYPDSNKDKPCRNDIVSYEIYFARYEIDLPVLIATVPGSQNSFTHLKNNKDGFAGCYYIRSKNSLGLFSEFTQKLCFDNCETLSFPNVFSPNADGTNDTFTPMNCPAFINGSTMTIYSTHGQKVRTIVSNTIEWDGKDDNGKILPPGTYYYIISVNFERLAKEGSTQEYKGYVTLIK